jgi:hypothetical protein
VSVNLANSPGRKRESIFDQRTRSLSKVMQVTEQNPHLESTEIVNHYGSPLKKEVKLLNASTLI